MVIPWYFAESIGRYIEHKLGYIIVFFVFFFFNFLSRGGMCALDIPDDLWEEMLVYRPNICILHLGGNDINPINPSIDVAKVFKTVIPA